jgi:uncharacterized protein YndB with AHSA1/START domain
MRRWLTVMLLTCAAALLLMRYARDQAAHLEVLASQGLIQIDAPVKASQEVVIEAPAERVWTVLTDIDHWPDWQSDIRQARAAGPVTSGTDFTWTTGGMHIQSKIARVEPNHLIAWTGTAFGARAVHVWKLERLSANQTRVKTDESMSGWLLPFFYSSRQLQASDRLWLDRLKSASESK